MRTLVFVSALLLSAVTVAQSPPDTIRGHTWASAPDDLGEKSLVEDDGAFKCYQKVDDDLAVGQATLSSAAYCYYKDRLSTVMLKFKGYTNFSALKNALFQKYGEGTQPNQFMEKYSWLRGDVFISFEYRQVGDSGQVVYLYMPLSKEKQRDATEAAKNAADKL